MIETFKIGSLLISLFTSAFDEYQKKEEEFQKILIKGEFEKVIAQLKIAPYLKNSRNELDRRTPLHVAVVNSHFELVQLLLELRADIKARDNFRYPPFIL